jgi:hypothetical protein
MCGHNWKMKGLDGMVISARFLLTAGHLIAILLTFWSYRSNVWIGFDDEASDQDVNTAERTVLVCS